MLRLESVRMMEREAEAKRKRLEQTSPQDKPQDQPAGQVSLKVLTDEVRDTLYKRHIVTPRRKPLPELGLIKNREWNSYAWSLPLLT